MDAEQVMKSFDKMRIVTWVLLLILIIISLFNSFTIYQQRETLFHEMRQSILEDVYKNTTIPIPATYEKGIDGVTPVKGIDYFDGKDGAKGDKGDSIIGPKGERGNDGTTPIKGVDYKDGEKGDKGDNGLTPQLRCNTSKNIWQVRYNSDESWQLLNGEKVTCTIKE